MRISVSHEDNVRYRKRTMFAIVLLPTAVRCMYVARIELLYAGAAR